MIKAFEIDGPILTDQGLMTPIPKLKTNRSDDQGLPALYCGFEHVIKDRRMIMDCHKLGHPIRIGRYYPSKMRFVQRLQYTDQK